MKKTKEVTLAVSLHNTLGKLMRKLRKQAGKQVFSTTEQATMALLEGNQKMLPSEIAEAHHISAQGVSQIINRLYEQACIEKCADETDKRKVYVSLSALGLEKLLAIRAARSRWLAAAIEKELSKEEEKQLLGAIVLLARLSETEIDN